MVVTVLEARLGFELGNRGAADPAINETLVVLLVAGGEARQALGREGHGHDQVGR